MRYLLFDGRETHWKTDKMKGTSLKMSHMSLKVNHKTTEWRKPIQAAQTADDV